MIGGYCLCSAQLGWIGCETGTETIRKGSDWQAIVEAYNNERYTPLYNAIKGVVFLGTPHQGSDLAGSLDFVLFASFSSRPFVKQLNPNSDAIAAINNSFSHRVESLKLISFFETDSTRIQWVRLFTVCGNYLVDSDRENDRSPTVRHFGLPERDQAWIEWRPLRNREIQLQG